MKLSPQMAAAVARMAPGAIVRDGMLGRDRRSLPDILDADNATVRDMGLDHQTIASRMRELTAAGAAGLGQAVRVEDRYEVTVDEFAGRMPCPLGVCGVFRKRVTTVRVLDTDDVIRWSDLGAHMIGEHGFYQGIGSAWRTGPDRLAMGLGLRPGGVPQEE